MSLCIAYLYVHSSSWSWKNLFFFNNYTFVENSRYDFWSIFGANLISLSVCIQTTLLILSNKWVNTVIQWSWFYWLLNLHAIWISFSSNSLIIPIRLTPWLKWSWTTTIFNRRRQSFKNDKWNKILHQNVPAVMGGRSLRFITWGS